MALTPELAKSAIDRMILLITLATASLSLTNPIQSTPCPSVTTSAMGCGSSSGESPQLEVFGDFSLGQNVFLVASSLPPGSVTYFALGLTPASIPLDDDCTFSVTPSFVGSPAIADASGSVIIPLNPNLAVSEIDFYMQAACVDPGNPGGFALTNALFLDFEVECVSASKLTEVFAGPDGLLADLAYTELLTRGVEGISAFMDLAGSVNPNQVYGGAGFTDSRSSWRAGSVPVQRMALYAIDGILRETPTPAHAPITFSIDLGADPDVEFLIEFQEWWVTASSLTLQAIKNLPGPLFGTGLSWAGDYLAPSNQASGTPSSVATLAFGDGGTGSEVEDSKTPIGTVIIPLPDPGFGPGHYLLPPADPNGPIPNNCLAHGLGYDDRWTQPGDGLEENRGRGATLEEIMESEGFTPEDEFVGPRFTKVELSYNSSSGQPNDDNWTHAIKVDPATGLASSKNGDGLKYNGITDTDAFRSLHYPPGTGQKVIVRVWVK